MGGDPVGGGTNKVKFWIQRPWLFRDTLTQSKSFSASVTALTACSNAHNLGNCVTALPQGTMLHSWSIDRYGLRVALFNVPDR